MYILDSRLTPDVKDEMMSSFTLPLPPQIMFANIIFTLSGFITFTFSPETIVP